MMHARIHQLLSSYGADSTRWPEPEHITAQQLSELLAHNTELAAAFADATALDAALDTVDRAQDVVDDLRTQRLFQSLQTHIQSLPQVTHTDAAEQLAVPSEHPANATVLPRAVGVRKPRSYALAWAAMLPLVFGFLAGMTSEFSETQSLLERTLLQTQSDPSSSVDTSYADEAMMAPFVVAAAFSTESGVHNR